MPKSSDNPKSLEYLELYIDEMEQWKENNLTTEQVGQLMYLTLDYIQTNVVSKKVPDVLKWPYGHLVRAVNNTYKKIETKHQKAQAAADARWGKEETKGRKPQKPKVNAHSKPLNDSQEEKSSEEEQEDNQEEKADFSEENIHQVCKKNIDDILHRFNMLFADRWPFPNFNDAKEAGLFIAEINKRQSYHDRFENQCVKVEWKKEWSLSAAQEIESFTIHFNVNGKIYPQAQCEDAIIDYMNTHPYYSL